MDSTLLAREHEALSIRITHDLVASLRCRVFQDGDMFCCLMGEDLQSGLAGFGPTPQKAVDDFEALWWTGKTRKAAP